MPHFDPRQRKLGKAWLDGDAALLLFFEAIGVDAGEGFHQAGLAVIDMACGPKNQGRHGGKIANSQRCEGGIAGGMAGGERAAPDGGGGGRTTAGRCW